MKQPFVLTVSLMIIAVIACSQQKSEAPAPEADAAAAAAGTNDPVGPPPDAAVDLATAIEEGTAHYDLGHYEPAAGWYEDALKIDPNSAEAHFNLALALDKLGHHQEASVHFDEANDLAGGNTAITESDILKKHIGG